MRRPYVGVVLFSVVASGACADGSKNPTAPDDLPIARLSIQIDAGGSVNAIYGYSPIRFDATASQADRPKYTLDFGDGEFIYGESLDSAVAVHRCNRPGLLTSRLTVVDRSGRVSTATASFPCLSLVHGQGPWYSLTYGWVNLLFRNGGSDWDFRKLGFDSQKGAVATGFYTSPDGSITHFTGTLSGDRNIRIVLDDQTIEFSGEVLLKDTFSLGSEGSSYYQNRHLILVTKGGSADGKILDFQFYDPF